MVYCITLQKMSQSKKQQMDIYIRGQYINLDHSILRSIMENVELTKIAIILLVRI